jgi:hypothetical protein
MLAAVYEAYEGGGDHPTSPTNPPTTGANADFTDPGSYNQSKEQDAPALPETTAQCAAQMRMLTESLESCMGTRRASALPGSFARRCMHDPPHGISTFLAQRTVWFRFRV